MSDEDGIYRKKRAAIEAFAFDEDVASVFDDMIRRSVPGYAMTLALMRIIAERYAQPDSRIYDLGSSLGAGIVAMAKGARAANLQWIGVDNAQAMLDRCRDILDSEMPKANIALRHENIQDCAIRDASIVVMNFTLQFIAPEQRLDVISKIHDGLLPGGAFLLSEKVVFDDPRSEQELSELHLSFKRSQGYSDLEISQKRSALDNVLVPESIQTHKERLERAGFGVVETWLQCFNFVSFIAIRK